MTIPNENPITLTPGEVDEIENKLLKFVHKVDTGKARSSETYRDVKTILELLRQKKEVQAECQDLRSSH